LHLYQKKYTHTTNCKNFEIQEEFQRHFKHHTNCGPKRDEETTQMASSAAEFHENLPISSQYILCDKRNEEKLKD
jgi:hypothetical protein